METKTPKYLLATQGDNFRKYMWVTPEQRLELHHYRKTGATKPDKISFGDWMGPVELKLIHRKICILHAAGVLNRYICREFDYSEGRLSVILSSSAARLYIATLRANFRNITLLKRAKKWGFGMNTVWGAW